MSSVQSVSEKYNSRGVSSTKEEVHAAVADLDKGIFPKAFCKIYPDYLTKDENYCLLSHADGAGTKSILAYLYWKETGDESVWKNIALDAIVMNTDDLICVGATDEMCFTSTIGRNKNLIDGNVIAKIIQSSAEFFELMKKHDIQIHFMGGETADVGDLVRTIIIDGTMTCRMKRSEVIDNANIQADDVIVGFASFGKTNYETEYNSGIGSNGITSARHDVLSKFYENAFPESFDPMVDSSVRFTGNCKLSDIEPETKLHVGKLLLSPTRTYLPLVKKIFSNIERKKIHGMVHCSGGGQTKVLHFVDNVKIIKNNLFDVPPIFKLIQQQSNTGWKEMYQVFNMGHRLEMYVDKSIANELISIAATFNIEAKIVGHVEKSESRSVTIQSAKGEFHYS
jgi:phosphoribosylformylglycinamidine cyclo-ligase